MKIIVFLLLLITSFELAAQKSKYGKQELDLLPEPPKYDQLYFWAAHPNKKDPADLVPGHDQLKENQSEARVDVFFVHPTIYTGKQHASNPWNADLFDNELNEKVDQSTIKNQASVFNESARVFAPRYRQAHYSIFSPDNHAIKSTALDYAYQDIKAAFAYYISTWNDERPIIIASHSQGTIHAARLIKEYIENSELQNQLVVAYLVGMPINKDHFNSISPCENPNEINCWTSWNTYKKGHYPIRFKTTYDNALSTNPLNWKIDSTFAHRNENLGGVLRNYKKIIPRVTDAQNYQGVLWSEKPHFPGRILLIKKRYHIADYNLFYLNIRKNVQSRVNSYMSSN
jgi:hypothetical protein